jgi:hypothetical protein
MSAHMKMKFRNHNLEAGHGKTIAGSHLFDLSLLLCEAQAQVRHPTINVTYLSEAEKTQLGLMVNIDAIMLTLYQDLTGQFYLIVSNLVVKDNRYLTIFPSCQYLPVSKRHRASPSSLPCMGRASHLYLSSWCSGSLTASYQDPLIDALYLI